MPGGRWSDEFLDRMRETGDDPADRAIQAVFAHNEVETVQRFLHTLRRNDDRVPDTLPAELRDCLLSVPEISVADASIIIEGEEFFARYGPEILVILACCALPASYAARKGVQVLHRTGFLEERPNRRLFQTAQMVIDVMTPGGLGPKGRGRATVQKVRLMHAAIRHLIRSKHGWDAALGVPINQEDLAGTLMTFTTVVLGGLAKLKVDVSARQAHAYFAVWQAIGRLVGIREDLIPDIRDAPELTEIIQRRQIQPSPEGQAMTQALLGMLEHATLVRKGIPSALMRHFLPAGVADGLGIPVSDETDFVEQLVDAGATLHRVSDSFLPDHLLRKLSIQLLKTMLSVELIGRRADFNIPSDLEEAIAVDAEARARLERWIQSYEPQQEVTGSPAAGSPPV